MNITIGFDLGGILLTVIIVLFLLFFKQAKLKDRKTFLFICIFISVTLFSDMMTWILNGRGGEWDLYISNYIFTNMVEFGILSANFLFVIYAYQKLKTKNNFNISVIYVLFGFYVVFLAFLFVCIPLNLVFKIDFDTNTYIAGPIWYIVYIFASFFLIISIVMISINYRFYKKSDFICLLILAVLPFVTFGINEVVRCFYGNTTIWLSLMSIGLAVVYINDQEFAILDAGFDKMTGLKTRNNYLRMVNSDYKNLKSCGVIFFDINNLKNVNNQFGHEAGDRIIMQVSQAIKELQASNIHSYRLGGDEFITIYTNCQRGEIEEYVQKWKFLMNTNANTYKYEVDVACGTSYAEENVVLEDLVREADSEMYRQKTDYKKKNQEDSNR